MPPIEVAAVDDLAESTPTIVRAGSGEIVLVRVGPRVYAMRNACPHMDVTFANSTVIGLVHGTTDSPCVDASQPVIVCPWHQYEFSLASGSCITSARLRARTYPVTVADGKVMVDLQRHAAADKDQKPRE